MEHPISQYSTRIPALLAARTFVAFSLLVCAPVIAQKLLIPVPLGEPAPPGTVQRSELVPTPEPERWTKEDLTWEEQYSTAKKEALAAHQIAKSECLSLSQPEQSFCLIQAKSVMDKEMSDINKRFGIPE